MDEWDAELPEQAEELVPVAPTPPVPVVPNVPVVDVSALQAAAAATQTPPAGGPARAVALDGSTWGEMLAEEQQAAMQIGYDEEAWDNGTTPETCNFPWHQLAASEQAAARVLGYTQEYWDSELEVPPPPPPKPLPVVPTVVPQMRQAPPAQPALTPVANTNEPWASARGRGGAKGNPNNTQQPSSMVAPARPISSGSNDITRFDSGMMFQCKRDTYDENIARQLFGLPSGHWNKAQKVGENTALFLFNMSTRVLYGVMIRDGPPGMNLEPEAWAHYRKAGAPAGQSPFPAQVRWKQFIKCKPVREAMWKDVPTIKSQGAPSGKGPPTQYDMWMNAEQAQRLAKICIANGIEN